MMSVASATELRATLTPASDATHKLLAASAVPVGAYARLATVQYPFELTVAKPDPSRLDPAQVKTVDDTLAQIAATEGNALRLKVVDASEPADVHLAVLSDAQISRLDGASGRHCQRCCRYRAEALAAAGERGSLARSGQAAALDGNHRRGARRSAEPDADAAGRAGEDFSGDRAQPADGGEHLRAARFHAPVRPAAGGRRDDRSHRAARIRR